METFSALLTIWAGNSPVPVNSSHKGQWRGALVFYLICKWINGWVNNREAGDLRRYRAHYDVTVMTWHWHGSPGIFWSQHHKDLYIFPRPPTLNSRVVIRKKTSEISDWNSVAWRLLTWQSQPLGDCYWLRKSIRHVDWKHPWNDEVLLLGRFSIYKGAHVMRFLAGCDLLNHR